jgi:hypothetical protein
MIVAAVIGAIFAGYLLWEATGRIEKVNWNAVEVTFRRR